MNKLSGFLLLLTCLWACKGKKQKHGDGNYFPVLSFIKGQVADVDSSLYRIIKIETVDSTSDTVYLKREQFRNSARDFVDLPDISSKKLKDDYEESRLYDDDLKAFILTYTTSEPANEVKREDVMIEPETDAEGNSKVKTIIIDEWLNTSDSTVHKNMVWQANKRFLIVTKTQKGNQPEKIKKTEVVWNGFPE